MENKKLSKLAHLPQLLAAIANHPLNRGKRLEALLRWSKWQIGSRLVPGPVLVPFVNSSSLLAQPGMTGVTLNIYLGLAEFREMGFLLHTLKSDDLFVDVGANIGVYTILAGSMGCRILAIEPIEEAFHWLRRNVDVNRFGSRVELHQCGVGECRSKLRFTVSQDTVNHVCTADESGDEVEVAALDTLLAGREVAIMKIDVEGFELQVLHGASKTLRSQKLRALILEVNGLCRRYNVTEDQIFSEVRQYGFIPIDYDPLQRTVSPRDLANENPNIIFVRNSAAIAECVSKAPMVQLSNSSI
jgi:FkbM family methyltransferase